LDLFNLTLSKYDICISIVVVKGADTGKLYDIKPIFSIVIK